MLVGIYQDLLVYTNGRYGSVCAMTVLTQDQKDQFWQDGYLVVDDAVMAA